jgi:hypothetical protein
VSVGSLTDPRTFEPPSIPKGNTRKSEAVLPTAVPDRDPLWIAKLIHPKMEEGQAM